MPENIQHCNAGDCTAPRTERRSVCEFHAIRCQHCNGHAVRGRYMMGGRYGSDLNVCVSCYEEAPTCANCDVRVSSSYMYHIGDAVSCHSCYNERTYYCSDCDIRVWVDGSHVCPPRSGLRAWDYRPMQFIRHGNAPGTTFGVELEVGVRGWNAGTMEELGEDLIWAKRDSSVESSDGFEGSELVSHPMTLDWFQSEGMRRWDNILGFVRENGGVNRTCGMHVHVGGESISRTNGHLATLMYLWNTNDEAIRRFCRRVANRYARTTSAHEITYFVERPERQDRYALVNLTNLRSGGSGTVEFRGFAATTDSQTFRASVEIVAASVEFTREFAGQAAGADWDAFGAWIFTHGETYPALASEWLVREVYEAYRVVPQGLYGLSYDLAPNPAPYGYTATGRVRQAPSEARRAAAARRYRDPQTGRLATAPEDWTPPVTPQPMPEWERELLARSDEASRRQQLLSELQDQILSAPIIGWESDPTLATGTFRGRDVRPVPTLNEIGTNANGFSVNLTDSWANAYMGQGCDCSGCREYRERNDVLTVSGGGLTASGGWTSAPDQSYIIGTFGTSSWDDEGSDQNF